MNKQLFIESIEAIRLQLKHDKKCIYAFKVILPDSDVLGYSNDHIIDQLIKVLKFVMSDMKECWIGYFIYELDFGAKYMPGCAKEKDGKLIDLSDSESLYDYLVYSK